MGFTMKKDNVNYLEIDRNVAKLSDMQMILKNCRLYNECLTLEANKLRIDNAHLDMEKVDMVMRDSYLRIDGGYLRIGESEIREDSSLVLESHSKMRLADKLIWEKDNQRIQIGGYDKAGYNILIGITFICFD